MKKILDLLTIKQRGILALVIDAFGYSLLGVAVRLMGQGFGPVTQGCLRLSVGAFIAWIILYKNIRIAHILKAPKKDFFVLFLMGTVGYSLGVYLITVATLQIKLLHVSVIFSTLPFFVYLYSFLFLKKKFNPRLLILLLISVFGVGMVSTKSFLPLVDSFGTGELFVLLTAASYGIYYVGRKMLSDHFNNSEITVLVMPVAFLSLLMFLPISKENIDWQNILKLPIILGIIIGAGFNILSNLLSSYGFKHVDSVLGSQVLLSENLFSFLLGLILYGEAVSIPEIFGGVIIIVSIFAGAKYFSQEINS